LGSLLAASKRYNKTFLFVSAFGKLSFFVLAAFYFFRGEAGFLALVASVQSWLLYFWIGSGSTKTSKFLTLAAPCAFVQGCFTFLSRFSP
jgi:hypothetical protein